jgi:RyR domain
MLDGSAGGYLTNMHGFGLLDQICRPEVILNLDREIFARAAHRDYVRRRLAAGADTAGDPALASWGDLSEDLRESNRAQVADIPAKLDAIGYEFAPTDDWDADLFRFTPEQVEKLSRIEHERYMEERLRAGYRYGPEKDLEAKLSPYLVAWEQLSESVRDLDRDAVRLIPSILAAAGYAIVPQRSQTPPAATRTVGVQDSASSQQVGASGHPHMVISAPSARDDPRDAQDP